MQEGIFVRFPVVWRELKDKKEQIKRKACVIIDNMVKLMQDPREVLPFLEVLLTALKKACDEISDPEARGKDALELAGPRSIGTDIFEATAAVASHLAA